MSLSNYNRVPGILTCQESARLLSEGLDRTLSRPERVALRLHLALCRRCRRFGHNLARLRDLLGYMTEQCLAGQDADAALTLEERARIHQKVTGTQSREF